MSSAKLNCDIPIDRYSMIKEDGNPPKKGDIVELDQGFTGKDGLPMGLVFNIDSKGIDVYEAQVYETELEIIIND